MGLFSIFKSNQYFPWISLETEEQLMEFLSKKDELIFIFKHSTRCSISSMAKSRFEREWQELEIPHHLLYLDLLNFRNISNKIEEVTGIEHQSPQLIVWKNGKVVHSASHSAIQNVLQKIN